MDPNSESRKMGNPSSETRKLDPPVGSGCSWLVVVAAVAASLSGLMLGYEMGLTSGVLLQLRGLLSLSCREQELLVSSHLFGALLMCLAGGPILDRYGRRCSLLLSAGLVVGGSIVLVTVTSLVALTLGRVIVGMGTALSGTGACLYIAEISPRERKGPRFLVAQRQVERARKVLARLRGGAQEHVEQELRDIQAGLKEESEHSFWELFSTKANLRSRLLTGVALVFLQQATGQPNILSYASPLLRSVGFNSDAAATLASTGFGWKSEEAQGTNGEDEDRGKTYLEVSSSLKMASLISLLVYVAAFSISLGPMVYVVLSEIFPMGVRGRAVSVVSAVNWATNLLISMTFLTITEKIGVPNVMFLYSAMSFVLLVFVILCIPETKGRTLEEISKELAKKKHFEVRLCRQVQPQESLISSSTSTEIPANA
ncbi:Solute carrier family 2, facilitated glucose transporter member 12 [Collichthys lucidus]|uniref:Solute carrier family 2, facilitated glucose transporter member 12 n=1 Tax=Collichthys lucidus TaxID=240159 RepID=A0A4U5UNB1_COLLU|nr:Solute carrier family 2, facilitated glucose transporter member 12 [Collichthys lucidus]